MKSRIWLVHLPIILLCTACFYIVDLGEDGRLWQPFLREKFFPQLRSISGAFTNTKFRIRGARPPKNKIVVVAIDSPSIDQIGRWPWHRDATAFLVDKVFSYGAKIVGLDITFSEPDQRIPDELSSKIKEKQKDFDSAAFETDPVLADAIRRHREKLVLGWMSETICQPGYARAEDECPTNNPDLVAAYPKGLERFAFNKTELSQNFDQQKTPVPSVPTFIFNTELFNDPSLHSGSLYVLPDADGVIRRMSTVLLASGKAYAPLTLEMARVGLDETLAVKLDDTSRVQSLSFEKSGRSIHVSPLGSLEINFRGPGNTFQYLSALDVLSENDKIEVPYPLAVGTPATSKSELLKDAYVLIGITALGVHDMRAFPFETNVPGVEGHANILDNLLAGDELKTGSSRNASLIILALMILGAMFFAAATHKLESVPALAVFILTLGGIGVIDQKLLFEHDINLDTSFMYLELILLFFVTVAWKYVMEERNKKFIRGAFSKYVAPAVVDSILKDPTTLMVGGVKKDLTIMFSDIRSFTTFSERMDAKDLAKFLNDYLGFMTDIVFENEGTLDKYIGDAVMAFWGAPLNQPKHASNACKAAIRMMQILDQHKARFLSQYGVDVNIGVGINSGAVNVGNMGSNRNFAYTVIGDHVNLASRLEGLTKYYSAGIITTRFTFDMIASSGEALPHHRVLDFVKVKGKANAVELIEVLHVTRAPEGLKIFEQARQTYLKRSWDEAIELFKKADELLRLGRNQPDGPSQMFIERITELKQTPPTEPWDGSWEMTSK